MSDFQNKFLSRLTVNQPDNCVINWCFENILRHDHTVFNQPQRLYKNAKQQRKFLQALYLLQSKYSYKQWRHWGMRLKINILISNEHIYVIMYSMFAKNMYQANLLLSNLLAHNCVHPTFHPHKFNTSICRTLIIIVRQQRRPEFGLWRIRISGSKRNGICVGNALVVVEFFTDLISVVSCAICVSVLGAP